MSASAVHRKNTRLRADAPKKNTRRLLLFGGIAVTAIALVGGLIAFQANGSSGASIPPRTVNSEGRILGDASAPVTVIEYADFQCPICKRADTAIIAKLQADYIASGKINVEFRNFAFLGQESFNAAQAADAAGEQGKFWEYHDALFNAQGAENSGTFTYDKLVAIANQIGLDVPAFEAALSGNQYLDSVQKESDSARQNGVSSTPTFFIGDKKIVGIQPYGTFTAAIDAALAKAAK